jgi:hypothetical protein
VSGEKRRCRDLGEVEVLVENWASGKGNKRNVEAEVSRDNAIEE